ncbi:MAG TPA: alpha-L-rhamnosidase N-terminal domain-containing protein, partial [Flavisolibacter sp.]|nr:alpha-L-rhamnosidase N-terminal domain-containing protein [Flavisolibacter sp.]
MKKLFSISIILLVTVFAKAQDIKEINPHLLTGWPASWVSVPGVPQKDYGVYHFRKSFNLGAKPGKFIVHISADNRYRLFVNGQSVCNGPARGDLYNWYFETVDIAPFLKSGNNVIAALVWNMGVHAPVAQISNQTAFVMQGNTEKEWVVNTGTGWKAYKNNSYTPCSMDNGKRLNTYMVIGPGDNVDAAKYPWGWEKNNFDDSKWLSTVNISNPNGVGYGTDNYWTLVPRNIPLMEESLQRIPSVRRTKGMNVNNEFLSGKKPLIIPRNKKVSILLDQTFNTVAYPEMVVSKGKGATITQTYTEALVTEQYSIKGNRNEIEGKMVVGNYDIFRPDGGSNRLFRPLWLRTYRYIQLDIETKDQELVINDMYGMYTGYPFEVKASFTSNDQSLQHIWDVGWRTARLCAGETYYDCPYYEQLQYEGDTRIQSLISLYVTGDDRLMRKALIDFNNSRVPEGLTQGRYPSNRLQVIPPFSLYWVSMIYDYMMHRRDDAFISQFLMPVKGVMDWYEKRIDQEKKMLGPMKWWGFVDWDLTFQSGVPPGATNGNSSVITLQYIYTLEQAADLFDHFGKPADAVHYRKIAADLRAGTYKQCFDKTRGVMANTPEKNSFSQHASIMGVLTGSIPEKDMQQVMNTVLTDTSLSQATFYYRFYLTRALKKAGMANLYYSQLKPWRDMLDIGLTTFAENPDPTRSDCHAWSSSPNYDFFATICGINPDKPGFASVRIEPAMGELKTVNATMPHPDGNISVSLQRKDAKGVT